MRAPDKITVLLGFLIRPFYFCGEDIKMDLLTGKIRPIYLKYLSAAFGSALITSVYSIVDMAMVGQYQGPDGTAALAVVAPVWNLIYSLGLLMGIGGSVIFSTIRGQAAQVEKEENQYFTAAVIGASLATVYKGNIIKNLIMDCQSYTKYRPNETTGGIFVSWRRKEELPTGA